MAGGFPAGTAWVDVIPEISRDFARDVKRQLDPIMGNAARDIGRDFARDFGVKVTSDFGAVGHDTTQAFAKAVTGDMAAVGSKAAHVLKTEAVGEMKIAGTALGHEFARSVEQESVRLADDVGKKFSARLREFGTKALLVGGIATAAVTRPIVNEFKDAIAAASDLEEAINLTGLMFGEARGPIDEFAKSLNSGLSERAARELTGQLGVLLNNLGFARDESAKWSVDLAKLGVDLGSAFNAQPEEVVKALGAALRGETEPARRYGVILSETAIKAEALAKGFVKANVSMTDLADAQFKLEQAAKAEAKALRELGPESDEARKATIARQKAEEKLAQVMEGRVPELTARQKADAALSLVMKSTSDVQGDYAKTLGSVANQQKQQAVQAENLRASVGTGLLPAYKNLQKVIQSVMGWFSNLSPKMQMVIVGGLGLLAVVGPLTLAIGALATVVGAILSPVGLLVAGVLGFAAAVAYVAIEWDKVWNWIKDHPALAAVIAILAPPVAAVVAIGAAIRLVATYWDEAWAWIKDATKAAWDFIKPIWQALVKAFEDGWEAISKAAKWAWDNVIKPVWEVIHTVATTVLIPLFKAIATNVDDAMRLAAAAVKGAWEHVIKPTWDAIQFVWDTFLRPTIEVIATVFRGVFDLAAAAVRDAWDIIEPILGAIAWAIDNVALPVVNKFRDVTVSVFGVVRDAVGAAWQWMSENVFDKIGGVLAHAMKLFSIFKSGVGGIFNGLGSMIGHIWNAILDVLAVPLRILGDVLGGILKAVSGIVRTIGLNDIAGVLSSFSETAFGWGEFGRAPAYQPVLEPDTVAPFARGGWIRGPRTHKDDVPIWATAGEFVIREHVAQQNRRQLEALNATGAWPPGDAFNLGGWVTAPARAFGALLGAGLRLVRKGLAQPVYAMKELFDVLPGGLFGDMFTGMGRKIVESLGDFVAGVESTAMAGLPGRGWKGVSAFLGERGINNYMASGYRPGAITISGNRSEHGVLLDHPDNAQAGDYVGDMPRIYDALLPLAQGEHADLVQLIWLHHNWRNGVAGGPVSGHGGSTGPPEHVHASTRTDLPAMTADDGHLSLPPGWSQVFNGLGRDERLDDVSDVTLELRGRFDGETVSVAELVAAAKRASGRMTLRVT